MFLKILRLLQHLQMHVYSTSRSLAKEYIWTRIETGGNKKNSSLVYIRFWYRKQWE